ncbi:SH3 domain-containing protein [Chloroflexales bacterium ZM16-3]|nr:SH3 domain-containing protein [Chloroflexales bacterium ZM16-3]
MTTERKDPETPAEKGASSGTTQVGQVISGLERLTRRLPSTRGRRPRPYRSGRPAPPRDQIVNLVAALGDTGHPLHAVAVDELVEIGSPAVPLLCDVIGPNRPWLAAYRAADAAGRIGDGRAAGPLLSALNHPNSNVRWSAVRALTTVGDVRALFELRRLARNDQGRTSWGEPVAGAAQSALDQLNQRSVWGQSVELIKTAVTSVLMILALTLAFSVVSTVRAELDHFGLFIPGQTELPQLVLPTVAPTATRPTLPTTTGLASSPSSSVELTAEPVPTSEFGASSAITGTVLQISNVRPQPNTNNQPIGQVNQGDEVIFLARTSNSQWYLVRLGTQFASASRIDNPDGSGTGWVNRALVTSPDGDLPVQEPVAIEPSPAPAFEPTASP